MKISELFSLRKIWILCILFNNNILGEYTLIKDEEEKKEEDEITTELLIDSLIDKVGKISSSNSGNLINMRESIRESYSYRESIRGNELIYDNPGKNEKLKKKFFEGVKYGVVLNKKYVVDIEVLYEQDINILTDDEEEESDVMYH